MLEPGKGLEPPTCSLRMSRTTNCANLAWMTEWIVYHNGHAQVNREMKKGKKNRRVPNRGAADFQLSSMRPRRDRLRILARCDFLRALTQGFSK